VGQTPDWTPGKQGIARYSGAGEFAGVLVVLVAFYALVQAGRKKGGSLEDSERKHVWFWCGVALVSLGLAFGRHFFLYHFVFLMPYYSTIRNPIKYMHPFHLAVIIMFGYGLLAMSRAYFNKASNATLSLKDRFNAGWTTVPSCDKRWIYGTSAVLAMAVLGWMMFLSANRDLMSYLQSTGLSPEMAKSNLEFSSHEILLFLCILGVSVALCAAILSGLLSGTRSRWAVLLLGLVLVGDLCRGNLPWVTYVDYKEKLATNPILDILKDKPWERRVTVFPFGGIPQLSFIQQYFNVEWLQHQFPYYNIQSLDIPQEPRKGQDKQAFEKATMSNPLRYWQLTNTRLIFGLAGIDDAVNQQLDPVKKRFRTHTLFSIEQDPHTMGITVMTNTTGPFALIEFTGALPRASLYSQWQVVTNDDAALQAVANPSFDPEKSVIVSSTLPTPSSTNPVSAGTVKFTSYSPKYIQFEAKAEVPSVFLLNDRYNENWKAWLDGKPANIFRCNYIARGLYLTKGDHKIEMRFEAPYKMLYVSLVSLFACLLGLVVIRLRNRSATKA
jgi:hypothetical protein